MRLRELLQESKESNYYVGNCKNSFNDDGECIVPSLPYNDTSHFANGLENAKKISKKVFAQAVQVPKYLQNLHNKNDTEHFHDTENKVHMMYDPKKDTHHFFA